MIVAMMAFATEKRFFKSGQIWPLYFISSFSHSNNNYSLNLKDKLKKALMAYMGFELGTAGW